MMWLRIYRSRGKCVARDKRGLEVHGTYHQPSCSRVPKVKSSCWIRLHNFLEALRVVGGEAQHGLYFVKPCDFCFPENPTWDELLPKHRTG